MSAVDVLMSSPRPSRLEPYAIDIFPRSPQKPPLRSGSRAGTIPDGAHAPEIDIETEKIANSPPRESRATKARKKNPILIDKEEVQKIEQPAISKARVAKSTTKRKPKEKPETRAEEKPDKGKSVGKLEDEHIAIDDWTPPPVNNPILIGSEVRSKDVFNTLLDQYGRKDESSAIATEQQQVDVLKKRKLIELVSTSNDTEHAPIETSPVKIVNAKKKTRTITELATAPYMLPIEPELDLAGPATKDSLLNYFDSDGAVKALVEHQTMVMSQKKGKAKETKANATTKPKRKRKSGTANNPILLSPNSALKQSSNQDFVFGTSSQLVREDSPSMLRDLQSAIRASNQVASDPFVDSDSQGLWHAGARDVDGDLINLDGVELVEDFPSLPRRKQAHPSCEEFVDINDILKSSELDESATTAPRQNSHFFQSQAIPSAQPSQTSDQVLVEPEPAAETINPRPDYESLTDAQLARQIASYGFKPVKKRQAMIALLDQCWTSKSTGTATNQSKSISTSSTMDAPKKKQQTATAEPEKQPKRRGRPRKQSTTETVSTTKVSAPKEASPKRSRGRPKASTSKTVEIADSDLDELTSSSSRASSRERDRIFSSPPAVDLSLSEDADVSLATTASVTDQQADVFRHITKAVTSAPRSQDPARPSWHEKMLLYDPVVLEDLAAWLNGGALGGVGYDGEVSPADVKKWCESKSVICLWRTNLNGKERKRY
ncbi:Slx4 endonuclease-domain-containing protein [Hypoxylon rubiginosum]|uniref:Slx4 endonuclease-domain-containing protein n=1 Tax=Hypoxylon rubiginosum TaxID=110542 RepID=A0ACC0CIL0_9PEZI|nr:Slx4 endonuclease-domain-containing protein [Hypoxylon rubiginosum]